MDPSVGVPPGVSTSSPGAEPPTGPQLVAAPGSTGVGASPGASTAAGEAAQPPAAARAAPSAPATGDSVPEVADSTLSLIEEIDRGNISPPGLFDWGAWQLWRGGAGREPPRPRGEMHGYRLQRESRLWRSTMSYLYGTDWNATLRSIAGGGTPGVAGRGSQPAPQPAGSAGPPAGQGSSLVAAGDVPGLRAARGRMPRRRSRSRPAKPGTCWSPRPRMNRTMRSPRAAGSIVPRRSFVPC